MASDLESTTNAEAVDNADVTSANSDDGAIEGTLYTRSWVLDLLVCLSNGLVDTSDEEGDELDDIQNDLCSLWDISGEGAVSRFLEANSIVDIVIPGCLAISSPSRSRIVEIAVGILANCCSSNETVRQKIATDQLYRQAVIQLFEKFSDDSSVLIQCFRLLTACCISSILAWQAELSDDFSRMICFTLASSKNEDLLLEIARLSDIILSSDEEGAPEFISRQPADFISAAFEALKELEWNPDSTAVQLLINSLHTLSIDDKSGLQISEQFSSKIPHLCNIVTTIWDDEEDSASISCRFAASLSLLLYVIVFDPHHFELSVLKPIWKIVGLLHDRFLQRKEFDTTSSNSSESVLLSSVESFLNTRPPVLDKILGHQH